MSATAARQPSNFEITLAEYTPQLAAVLPPHISIDRFKRVIITAVNKSPDLMGADRRSLFNACVQAATDGLLPDGREAALVIYNTKVKRGGIEQWIALVQYLPMIAGIRKRMRNTGEVDSATAHVVYKHDKFSYRLGDDAVIEHEPTLDEPGPPLCVYAIIKLKNGEVIRDVMSVSRVERARSVSRSKDGPAWKLWWDEMACKTVLRHAAKSAPVSADMERLLSRDEPGDEIEVVEPPRPRLADYAALARDAQKVAAATTGEGDAGPGDDEDEPHYDGDIALEVADGVDRQTGEIRP